MKNINEIKKELKIEDGILLSIISDPEFITGVNWGKPRKGHPEGSILEHIKEIFNNIEKFYGNKSEEIKETLKIIALIHDTFKYKVDPKKPKTGENHHGYFAMKFAEKFNIQKHLCKVILRHDDAYNIYKKSNEYKIKSLINDISNELDIYTMFYNCDVHTGNKTDDDYKWFLTMVEKYNG
jgi:hypothetical protein